MKLDIVKVDTQLYRVQDKLAVEYITPRRKGGKVTYSLRSPIGQSPKWAPQKQGDFFAYPMVPYLVDGDPAAVLEVAMQAVWSAWCGRPPNTSQLTVMLGTPLESVETEEGESKLRVWLAFACQ